MARWHRRYTLATLSVVLGIVVAACGGNGGGTPSSAPADGLYLDGELVIPPDLYAEALAGPPGVWYTTINESVAQPIVDTFVEQTGIRMEMVRVNPDVLFERILSEYGAGTLGADVITMSDIFVPRLAGQGIVVPHEVPAIKELDSRFYAEDYSYYSMYTSPLLLVYNSAVLPEDQVPSSWKELAEPGRIECGQGWVRADASATAWTLALFSRQVLGEDFWERHAANKPTMYDGNSPLTQALGLGEICIAPNSGTSTEAGISNGAPLKFVIPEEGLPSYDVYIGVTSVGPNSAAGKAFLNWTMSREGMKVASSGYGPRSDIDPPTVGGVALPPIENAPLWKPDPGDYETLRESWIREWQQVYGYEPTD